MTRKNRLRGVIFDIDGVIANLMELHYSCWKKLANEENIPISSKIIDDMRGVGRRRSLELLLNGKYVSPEQFTELMQRKNRYYQKKIDQLKPSFINPGITSLLDELQAADIKRAIGSNSTNARKILEQLKISDKFDFIADGYSVKEPKPAPEIFLHISKHLDIEPKEVIVIEDAASGIEAALNGGFLTIAIDPYKRLDRAHLILEDTISINLSVLITLFDSAG